MNPLELEYKRLRAEGLAPVAALESMRAWRAGAIDSLLALAEKLGMPPGVQSLVITLNAELGKLSSVPAGRSRYVGQQITRLSA